MPKYDIIISMPKKLIGVMVMLIQMLVNTIKLAETKITKHGFNPADKTQR